MPRKNEFDINISIAFIFQGYIKLTLPLFVFDLKYVIRHYKKLLLCIHKSGVTVVANYFVISIY